MRDAEQPSRETGRIVELGQTLIGFQEHFLAHVKCIFTIRDQPEEIVINTLLPSGNKEVIGLHVSPPRFGDQVKIFDLAEDQFVAPFVKTRPGVKKSDRALLIRL
jgi:hypothetical protein